MSAPAIISRAAWGANPLHTPASSIATPTGELWLHHTASTGLHGAAGMRSLQANAIAGGYVDLEYSFVVDDPDGSIYESRGPGRNTAAQNAPGGPDNNATGSAICAMGNYELEQPADALLDAIAQLVAHGAAQRWWPAEITGPHRNAPGCSTACCGRYLVEQIPEINRRAAHGVTPPAPELEGGAMNIRRTSSGRGYWICAADGGVFAYGDAGFYGSAFGHQLAAPIVGLAAAADGRGYALAGADGGVFCFGSMKYLGGMSGQRLAAPIVAIEADADGAGYWLLGGDGGVFAFGAVFAGSASGKV